MLYTQQIRQEIIREFASRHEGRYEPRAFLDEVRSSGSSHPAYAWFQWNNSKAADEYRLQQARDFSRDLKITFEIEDVGRTKPVRVIVSAPMLISPMESRQTGGGYRLFDPDKPVDMEELCRQAAQSLTSWLARYQAVIEHSGGSVKSIERQITALEKTATKEIAAA